MNYIDIVLGIILLTGLVRGFLKGFIFEIAILGALFLCYFIGFRLVAGVSPHIAGMLGTDPLTTRYVSWFVVFIGISIGMVLLAKLLTGLINMAALGVFNKVAGAVFAGIKYAFIISLALFFFNKFDSKYQLIDADKKAESVLYYPLMKIAPVFLPVLTEKLKDAGEETSA